MQREGLPLGSVEAYAFATGCVAAAAIGGFAYLRFVEDVTLAIPYYAAVFVSALLTGVRGGTLAAALSALLLWWIDGEYFGAGVPALVRVVNGASYILSAILTIWIAAQLRQRSRAEKQEPRDQSPSSGVVVPFPIKISNGALVHLTDAAGAVLPFGSVATLDSTGAKVPVGYDGEAYFVDLEAHNNITVEMPDGRRCAAAFDYQHVAGKIPSIGPLACREAQP